MLLKCIIKRLQAKFAGQEGAVVVTASTGLAARQIGGQTIHSFATFNDTDETAEVLASGIERRFRVADAWRRAKVLVVDEVSMLDGYYFNKIGEVAKILRTRALRRPEPFGGLQLVVTGDFFQLPPVKKGSFAFESTAWEALFTGDKSIQLTRVFRQSDRKFISLLNDMRLGILSPESAEILRSLQRPVVYDDHVDAVQM